MRYKYVLLYLRLSQDDFDKEDESNSIQNQRLLLKCFVEQNEEFQDSEILIFVDDGYTGTNFNRPDFKEMMDFARKNSPCCIIVKDLSRLGRDTIDMQEYMEKVFPFLQVRFIAVNDFYDSNDTLMTRKDTEAKFKNLLNGLYPQICSRNIKQVKKAKAKEGNYHGSVPTFGYLFKEDDRKSLVLDKEVSWIVRYIFDERIKGVKYTEIARILNEKKIITPIEHFRKKGYKMPSKNVTPLWNINMIRKILANPTYTGAVVNNKTDNMIVSVKSPKAIPREDWICVANKHEAIVTMDEMKIVMGMIKPVNTYHKKLEVPRNIFRSKVKCGHCQRMLRVRDRGPERIKMSCTTPTKISDTKCYRGSILAKDIENLVLQLIRQQALLSIDALGKIKEINKTLDIPRLRKQKGYYEAKIDSGKQEKMDMYELCVLGEIHTETFLEKKEILSRKECQYKQKVLKLKEKIAAAEEEKQKEQDCFLRKFAQYADLETLTYPIVQELVDMIYFYDHEHIEVIWNYADEFIKVSGESFDC
ncbi:MAG: recombinase family protein [Clostridiales bacterium]|nr:recombinase family protein [Clostridiales bacterium]MDU3241889.1 recombinase family protein [Clostridiales bacterium]